MLVAHFENSDFDAVASMYERFQKKYKICYTQSHFSIVPNPDGGFMKTYLLIAYYLPSLEKNGVDNNGTRTEPV